MKILINTPSLKLLGGVANHYLGLKDYWTERVKYNTIGKRTDKNGSGVYWFPFDILKYIFQLAFFSPDIVLLNPSLGKTALARDVIFLSIAKFFNKKAAIFFHGFNKDCLKKMNTQLLAKQLNKATCIFILAEDFKKTLIALGVTVPIYMSTTKVNDSLLEEFDIRKRTGCLNNILFLARITKEKGIFIAIDTFAQLKKKHPNLNMIVIGDGDALVEAKKYCDSQEIRDICFKGRLDGMDIALEYAQSDLYLFPSFHEGMPTSVLEAMSFGLPVITRPVGGLVDFFEDRKMGTIIDSYDPSDFATAIEQMLINKEKIKEISYYNHEYATRHFLASSVAQSIEKTLKINMNIVTGIPAKNPRKKNQ